MGLATVTIVSAYGMDRWVAMSRLALGLSRLSCVAATYEGISRRLASPLVLVKGAVEAREVLAVYAAFPRKPVRFFLGFLYVPGAVFGHATEGHSVGLVADLARSNIFHYFDPMGNSRLSDQRRYDYLRFVFNALRPVVQESQRAGHLMSTPTPFSFRQCNTFGLQRRQSALFRGHGVSRETGMCAFMTTLTLFEFERHEGHMSLRQISNGLVVRPVEAMLNFTEAVWPDVADVVPADGFELLEPDQMQRLLRAVAASANTASVAAGLNNPEDGSIDEADSAEPSGTRVPRRKRTWSMTAANRQAPPPGNGQHDGHTVFPPESQEAKRRAVLTTADGNTSRQRLGSLPDVTDELDWLFFNCKRGELLEVWMTDIPAARLGVMVVGRDIVLVRMLTDEAPDLKEFFQTNVEGLVSMLEFRPSVLTLFGRAARVTSGPRVFWTRANGYHLQTMERSGWFPFI